MEDLALFDTELRPASDALPPRAPAAAPDPRSAAQPSVPAPPEASPGAPLLLAVDGNSLAHRAFHAYADGPGARYGFLSLLSAVGDRVGPDAVVVGFDCRAGSTRRDVYPAYKAGRPPKDPRLDILLDEGPELCAAFGVTVVQPAGWEADDVVGSAAATAEAAGWRCVVATSDKDAFGLVSDATTVLRLRSGLDNAVEVTPARLGRDLGIRPSQYVEFAALCGDTSDNLPGVAGIGPKRARLLLQAFGTVAEAMADPLGCRSVLGPGPGQALLDDLADVEGSVFWRNVELMTIRRDVPVDLTACRRRATPAHIEERCATWGVPSLAFRLALAVGIRPDAGAAPPPTDADAPV
jgi:DNA polymerase I